MAKLALLFFVVLLASCSVTKKALKATGISGQNTVKNISVESSRNSNMGSPVAVDLVFVKDQKVATLLSTLNGPDWFKEKGSLQTRYEKQIDIVDMEVVPGQIINKVKLPKQKKKAKNIFLFANYRSPNGQYVSDISLFSKVEISLLRDTYKLKELK